MAKWTGRAGQSKIFQKFQVDRAVLARISAGQFQDRVFRPGISSQNRPGARKFSKSSLVPGLVPTPVHNPGWEFLGFKIILQEIRASWQNRRHALIIWAQIGIKPEIISYNYSKDLSTSALNIYLQIWQKNEICFFL